MNELLGWYGYNKMDGLQDSSTDSSPHHSPPPSPPPSGTESLKLKVVGGQRGHKWRIWREIKGYSWRIADLPTYEHSVGFNIENEASWNNYKTKLFGKMNKILN